MGFLPAEAEAAETALDLRLVGQVAARLSEAGIAREPAARLGPRAGKALGAAELEDVLQHTLDAVDASPRPDGEWGPARELLGEELLARLLGVSVSSVRRYAAGGRPTPDNVAWRLHGVARILASLLGSYNGYGIRGWFVRPRTALEGRTPAALVAAATSEDDDGLQSVIALANALVGAAAAA